MFYFLFLLLTASSLCKLLYLNTSSCTKKSQGYLYTDVQTDGNYLTTTQINPSFTQFLSYEPLGQTKQQYGYTVTNGYYPQLRIPPSTLYSFGNFLTFDQKKIYLHSSFNSALIVNLNVGSLKNMEIVSDVCFGRSLTQIFALIALSQNYSMYIYNNSISTYTVKATGIPSSLGKDRMVCKNGRIFINLQTKLVVYAMDSSMALLYTFTYPLTTIYTMELKANNQVFAFSYDNLAYIYNYTTATPTLISAVTLNFSATGLDLVQPSYIVFTSNSQMIQYDYQINLTICSLALNLTNSNQKVFSLGTSLLVVIKDLMISPFQDYYLYYYSVNDVYQCGGCLVCPSTYIKDSSGNCVKGYLVPTPTDSTTNATNTTTTTPNASINSTDSTNTTDTINMTNLTNQTNGTIEVNTTNTTDGTNITNSTDSTNITDSTNSTNITNNTLSPPLPTPTPTVPSFPWAISSSWHSCLQFKHQTCTRFCSLNCLECDNVPRNCTVCSSNRAMNYEGECELPTSTIAIFTFANLLSSFRVGGSNGIFFLLDNFQKYQYHKTNYTGTVQYIIQELNDIENLKWNIVPLDTIIQWSNSPIETLAMYAYFTNPRFLQVQRNSSFLIQSTKSFFALYIPFLLLLIFLLNRLFHCIKHLKISQFFRLYSFGLQSLIIIVICNASRLCFLCMHYLSLLFYFSWETKLMHYVAVPAVGMIIIALMSIFFMSQYLYQSLSKYFLINLYRIKFAYGYSFVFFSLRPLIQSVIHVQFYNNPQVQLLIFAGLQAMLLLLSMLIQLRIQIYKSKLLYVCEFSLSFCLVNVNVLLWFKHYYTHSQIFDYEPISDAFENCIATICITMMAITALGLMLPVFDIFSCFCQRNKLMAKDIWNWGKKKQNKKNKNLYNKFKEQITNKQVKKRSIKPILSKFQNQRSSFVKQDINLEITQNNAPITIVQKKPRKRIRQSLRGKQIKNLNMDFSEKTEKNGSPSKFLGINSIIIEEVAEERTEREEKKRDKRDSFDGSLTHRNSMQEKSMEKQKKKIHGRYSLFVAGAKKVDN